MNAFRSFQPTPSNSANANAKATAPVASALRHEYRERDFGVGYGNSSGYASARRYADHREQPRFRCV